MDESGIDEECAVLNRRRREITGQLQALIAQDDGLDDDSLELRRGPLLSELREIDRCLADIQLDEQSLRRMEGGE